MEASAHAYDAGGSATDRPQLTRDYNGENRVSPATVRKKRGGRVAEREIQGSALSLSFTCAPPDAPGAQRRRSGDPSPKNVHHRGAGGRSLNV